MGKVSYDFKNPTYSLEQAKREMLWEWVEPRWKKEAGWASVKGSTGGGTSWSVSINRNGTFVTKHWMLAFGLLMGIEGGVRAASAGALGVGFLGAFCMFPMLSKVYPSLGGAVLAWRKSKNGGERSLRAFSTAARSFARKFMSSATPNIWKVGVIAVYQISLGASMVYRASAAGSKLEALADTVESKSLAMGRKLVEQCDLLEQWKFEQEVESVRLSEGALELTQQCYAEMARKWAKHHFMLEAKMDSTTQERLDELIGPQGARVRKACNAYINSSESNADGISRHQKLCEAAGLMPWSKPLPDMPSLLELSIAVNAHNELVEPPNEEVCGKLAAWRARQEAQDLRSVVGEAVLIKIPSVKTSQRQRL